MRDPGNEVVSTGQMKKIVEDQHLVPRALAREKALGTRLGEDMWCHVVSTVVSPSSSRCSDPFIERSALETAEPIIGRRETALLPNFSCAILCAAQELTETTSPWATANIL